MNSYIIGIFVLIVGTGLGTYLMYVGSGQSSAASQKELMDKIEETRQEIAEAKDSTNPDKQEIEKIENEFNSWANEFVKNKDLKKLELEKENINTEGSRIALSAKWKPQLDTFLSSIRNIIDAYNRQAGASITYDINKLPENIFDPSAEEYEAKIIFKPDIIWLINIAPASALAEKQMPSLTVSIFDQKTKNYKDISSMLNTKDVFGILIRDDSTFNPNPIILIVKHKNDRYSMKNIPQEYEVKDDTFKELAKDLVESQLLQL